MPRVVLKVCDYLSAIWVAIVRGLFLWQHSKLVGLLLVRFGSQGSIFHLSLKYFMNDLLLLSTICFVAMVSPGPDFILVTRNALLYHRSQALATTLGIIAGCMVHATYCMLGLALIITKNILLFSLIKYAGACYLIYLGIKGLTSKAKATTHEFSVRTETITIKGAFLQGFLCNLLNPKLAVFLLSLFTQFISINATFTQKASVAGIFVLESMIYWPLVAIIFQRKIIRELFVRSQTFLDRLFGALLVGLGVRVAVARD